MAALRIVLIVANALLFAFFSYTAINQPGEWRRSSEFVMVLLICLALNFIYLLLNQQTSNWRIFRLIGLWFDAKESELRRRANQNQK